MINYLKLILVVVIWAQGTLASQLIHKSTVELAEKERRDVVTLDTGKYSSLRVAVKNIHEKIVSRTDYSEGVVGFQAVEDDITFWLFSEKFSVSTAFTIADPTPRSRIWVDGRGTFLVYVWGTLRK